jgi:hypothetical protein
VLVLYRGQSRNRHTGYPMAMRSFSQVLESNVLREEDSFDDVIYTQIAPAFDSVLDRSSGAVPGLGPLELRLRMRWLSKFGWDPGTGCLVRGPGGGRPERTAGSSINGGGSLVLF